MKQILFILAIVYSLLLTVTSCELIPAIAPLDWKYDDPIVADTIDTDTIVIDSLPIDSIVVDPECEDSLYLEPEFVSGWWYIPDYTIDSVQVCVYPHCVTVAFTPAVVGILDSLLNVYDPSIEYEVFANFPSTFCFMAKGTNNKDHYNGEVWLRPVGFHSGWGFDCVKQSFWFFNTLTPDQYIQKIDEYPSFNRFMFQYTNWDSLEYIKVFDKILECRIGRSYADLRYLPFTFPDSVYQKFEDAGWYIVLH